MLQGMVRAKEWKKKKHTMRWGWESGDSDFQPKKEKKERRKIRKSIAHLK